MVAREHLRKRKLPFVTPDSILNEFHGRKPDLDFKDRIENSVELKELLMDLGTMTASAEKIEKANNRNVEAQPKLRGFFSTFRQKLGL